MCANSALESWVDEAARLTRPSGVVWCDGSESEYRTLVRHMLRNGVLIKLNQEKRPGCYLHRSHPSDVARTEHLTFICSKRESDSGPLNNWMAPAEARARVGALFSGCMEGRTLYVVPYLLSPPGSGAARVGVEITDSPYVAASLRIMTRMGKVALDHLGASSDFVRGLHSLGDLDPSRRFICHFPEERLIWSIGSGYGGNALLSKKCFALRIASVLAHEEGWLAEHMLIIGVEAPDGKTTYMAGAFPSGCGKTNLAMLVPPATQPGYKVWTVGDDIAWLRVDGEGRLRAINPEHGFFGIASGTGPHTNPVALETIASNTLYTNVAVTRDGMPWWEGLEPSPPPGLLDWRGAPWDPAPGPPAAHPNSRFTAPVTQCPTLSPRWEDPDGVPISALIFGGRRSRVDPLVSEAFDWKHGVFVGATLASETTAAATGDPGKLRRDPMAMRPFCGYNAGDYFAHWLEVGKRLAQPPKVYHVNWFRRDDRGHFVWPGYGENLRVLRWIIDRCEGRADSFESPIGHLPLAGAIDLDGLDMSLAAFADLFHVSRGEWEGEHEQLRAWLTSLGDRVPAELWDEHGALGRRLGL